MTFSRLTVIHFTLVNEAHSARCGGALGEPHSAFPAAVRTVAVAVGRQSFSLASAAIGCLIGQVEARRSFSILDLDDPKVGIERDLSFEPLVRLSAVDPC